MKLGRIAEILGAALPAGTTGAGVEVADLAYDSRRAGTGSLFFCVPGAVTDGHWFAGQAVAAGAVALVCAHPIQAEPPIPQLIVEDSRRAMASVACEFFGHPSREMSIAGVTGTNGKTTTVYMLDAIFRAAGASSGLISTIERRIGPRILAAPRGTPEAIDLQRLLREMVNAGVTRCAMEVTSEGIAQGRTDGTGFEVAVFTNLTQDHLNFHHTMENYYLAKRFLFTDLARAAVVNVDDEWGRRLVSETSIPVATFGTSNADFIARDIRLGSEGSSFRIAGRPASGTSLGLKPLNTPGGFGGVAAARRYDSGAPEAANPPRSDEGAPEASSAIRALDIEVRIQMPGVFNVINALGAAVAASLLGIAPGDIALGLKSLTGVPGRFERVDAGQPFAVIVDYAHTPDALAGVLAAARGFASRVILVFGCGGDRDAAKRPLMGEVAGLGADLVFATSDNPRSEDLLQILREIEKGLAQWPPPLGYEIIPDRAEAIGRALSEAKEGDAVVIAGKGHERGQEFAGRKIDFDDRRVAADALRKMQ